MEDSSQVTGDAPPTTAVKRRKPKSAVADVLRSLLRTLLMSTLKEDVNIQAQLRELDRRMHGNS